MLKTEKTYDDEYFEQHRKQKEWKRALRMINELKCLGYYDRNSRIILIQCCFATVLFCRYLYCDNFSWNIENLFVKVQIKTYFRSKALSVYFK